MVGAATIVAMAVAPARAEETPVHRELPNSSDLDGLYLYLGPTAGLVSDSEGWDGAFGGAASLVRVREQQWLGAVGISAGAARFTLEDRGRIWLDAVVGSRRPLGGKLLVGLSAGPVMEVDDLRHPRFGAEGRFWCFVGVVPYVRFGVLERSDSFFEVGLEVALPAVRW
jgi:hypothetical protein